MTEREREREKGRDDLARCALIRVYTYLRLSSKVTFFSCTFLYWVHVKRLLPALSSIADEDMEEDVQSDDSSGSESEQQKRAEELQSVVSSPFQLTRSSKLNRMR